MRIGIDATALPSKPVGAGTYTIQLIRALAALETEHEFVIFAHRDKRVLIDVPPKPGLSWVLVPDKSPPRRLVWEQTLFPRLVHKSGVQLLHSLHYTQPFFLSCSSVVTFHDMTYFIYPQLHTRSKRIFFPIAIRLSAKRANALIASSENTRQDAIRLVNIPNQKISTVRLGIDEHFTKISNPAVLEETRRKYNLPDEFILFVGAVEPRKDLPNLLKALSKLISQGSSTHLVIVGRLGWMYEEVFRQVEILGLGQYVHFTGYIPDKDLPIVYNLAQLFVYPSIYEGVGIPPLEAMACGTPVITTNVSSIPEYVNDACILVPPKDTQALSQAIYNTLKDTDLQYHLAQKGPKRSAHFTWKRTAQETVEIYQRIQAA